MTKKKPRARTYPIWIRRASLTAPLEVGAFYHRTSLDTPDEWRGWKRAVITLSPPKRRTGK